MDKLTQHAATRMQQRGIASNVVNALIRFGARSHDHRHGVIHYFDKEARKRLKKLMGNATYRELEGQLNAYAVLNGEGDVVTVGHRFKRLPRQ